MSGLLIVGHKLNANAALKAVVPVSRQFLVVAQQGAEPPYLVISQVSGSDVVLINGQGEYPQERIQIDVVATTYSSAREVMDLVKAALKNTIKQTISPVGVKDVDIILTGLEVTDYSDDRSSVIIITDCHVRWRAK